MNCEGVFIPNATIDDAMVDQICEFIMERRREIEPDDTPHWKDFIADPANADSVAKWRLHTRCAIEGILKFSDSQRKVA